MRLWAFASLLFLAVLGCGREGGAAGSRDAGTEAGAAGATRIVSVGGTVTEIVYALGCGADVVAIDTSSVHPPEAQRLPQVGYQRTLAAEGIAAQRPTRLLLSAEAGPPAAVAQLRGLGVPLDIVPAGASVEGAKERIRSVARALGKPAEGEDLVRTLSAQMADAEALLRGATSKPKVLFVYARGAGALMVGGADTPADAMIQLAAGENAARGFEGFKPLTAEAVATGAPDVILVAERGLASIGGIDGLLAQPGVELTPAGKARRVVTMDDLLLLGFGPRLGLAVRELAIRLHPELGGAPR
jgi:iron complex transport system substrate-binding protein